MAKKNKKDGAGFMPAMDVAALAQELIRKEDEFKELAKTKILYLFTRKPQKVRGGFVPFTVSKLGGIPAFLAGPTAKEHEWAEPEPQFQFLFFRNVWLAMTDTQKEAAVYKALCHCQVETLQSGGKRLQLVKPDIEEFTDVVAKYGQAWLPDEVLRVAVSGQATLPVNNEIILPRPENSSKKKKGPIHDKEYEGGHLTG